MFVSQSNIEKNIADAISPAICDADYELVKVSLTSTQNNSTLQVMFERSDNMPIGVDDCKAVNSLITPILDAADLMKKHYILEVSSPGLNRPLTRLKDFTDSIGMSAQVVLKEPMPGTEQRRFAGVIESLIDSELTVSLDDGTSIICAVDNILEANIITDFSTLDIRKSSKKRCKATAFKKQQKRLVSKNTLISVSKNKDM